ncbi:MAG: carboxylating nicotinate-nucleotide diphosphorylase [Verrucomicrobiota bacterium]
MGLLSAKEIQRAVRLALAEDVGTGDVTSLATVPADSRSRGLMVAREPLVVAGLPVAVAVFRELSRVVKVKVRAREGRHVKAGTVLLEISGPTRAILTGERTALNFIQRLSGIATTTAQFVAAVAGTRAKILDTRKTTPGLRVLEKYAVACGGGRNHRIGLYDSVLIKDNHLAALSGEKPNAIAAAVQRARKRYPKLKIEVEADTLEQVAQAVAARPDIILLDNMTPAHLITAVKLVHGRAKTEASGGVNLRTVRAIAHSGVDYISVGAVTHSARAMDIALDFVEQRRKA